MKAQQKLLDGLRRDAAELGFSALGVASPDAGLQLSENLKQFTDNGFHGTMDWMVETLERRSHPSRLWPEVKSIIVLAMNYGPESDPLLELERRDHGTISVYARNRDYHDVIKGRLKTLAAKLVSSAKRYDMTGDVKVFVDTAPVMEKPLANRSGLGWQGKHTNLVSKEFGSWVFLGSIFTTLDLPISEPANDHCGSCQNCLKACPTNAFPAPYQIDARRCISYLTIEHHGPIPEEFRKPMGNRIYGCDDCLAVCPWNKFASVAQEMKLAAPKEEKESDLSYYLSLDDQKFRKHFSGSPVKRIGRNRFIRNCLIAAGNSGNTKFIRHIQQLKNEDDPVIQDAAQWALDALGKAES